MLQIKLFEYATNKKYAQIVDAVLEAIKKTKISEEQKMLKQVEDAEQKKQAKHKIKSFIKRTMIELATKNKTKKLEKAALFQELIKQGINADDFKKIFSELKKEEFIVEIDDEIIVFKEKHE